MINIGIGVSWAKALYSVANNIIANFRARVLSYPNSIFEAGPCLDATLEELNAIGLLDNASLIVTPNAYNEGVLYDVIPNTPLGDMNVVRATTATRVNSAGLIEVVPRNLLAYSQDFTNGWSSLTGSGITATANYGIAPDGTNTSTRIVFSGSNLIWVNPNFSNLIGNTAVFSLYIKGTIGQTLLITCGGAADETITLLSGWNRFDVTSLCVSNNIFINTFGGATARDIEVWGGQVEFGSTATEYFPTTTRLNIPRIDYTNGSCPSLLVEPQRTNTVLNSNNSYQNGVNGSSSTTTIPSIISGVNYRKMTATAVDGYIYCDASSLSSSPTGLMCFSIFLKKGTCDDIQLIDQNSTGKSIRVNLNNGSIISQSSGLVCGVQPYSDNVYRVFIVQDYTSIGFRYDLYAKEIGDFYYIGAQFESGSYTTSIIPTNGSAVTRNADVISKTGISSLIGQTEGTLFLDFELLPNNTNGSYLFALNDGTLANMIRSEIYILSPTVSQFRTGVNTLGVSQGDNFTTISQLKNKMAISYSLNNLKIFINGVLVATDTSVTIPVMNAFYLGNRLLENIIGSSYKQAMLFKTQLTEEELTLLTGNLYNTYEEMANNLNYILQ